MSSHTNHRTSSIVVDNSRHGGGGGWGSELWDRYDQVTKEVGQGVKDLESWYGGYLKERSKVEADYAKALRKLVKNFTIKEKHRHSEDESTQARGFRLILQEVGYQAGQHELLSDCYGKDCNKMIENHVKNVKTQTKKIKKEAEEIEEKMRMSYKQLDKRKINYADAHAELEATKNSTETDEKNLSRLELDKKISVTNKKTRVLDDAKAQYAHQLIKTNNHQQEYFDVQLPSVLTSLQRVFSENVQLFKTLYGNCIEFEQNVAPIISKCHSEMLDILDKIDADTDTNIVINRLKTGNVPPSDFQFEELSPGVVLDTKSGTGHGGYLEKRNSLIRVRSRQNLVRDKTSTNINYYQMKREIEKNIETVESELEKGQKEMKSLQIMVNTYRTNPKFGDVTKFESELDSVTLKVQHSQSQLYLLQNKLKDVNSMLENIKNKTVDAMKNNEYEHKEDIPSVYGVKTDKVDNNNKKTVIMLSDRQENTSDFDDDDYFDSSVSFKSDEVDDISEDRSEKKAEMWIQSPPRAVAMYPFHSENSETLTMKESEEFFILEDDVEGWTKVRRKIKNLSSLKEIGYVPSSFIKLL